MLSQMLKNGFLADGVRWVIGQHPPKAIPLCPNDFIKLDEVNQIEWGPELKCEECGKIFTLPRNFDKEREHILNKINSKTFKAMKFINLDDEAIPIAESKVPKNSGYFVTSILTESKVGLRLVVYAGKDGQSEKTQIFVEPEIKRLAFDQTNLHPTDIFTKLEATFIDGSKASIEKRK